MQLEELQLAFQARILEGRPGIEPELMGGEPDHFDERLEVYTLGYRSRLVEALGTTFSAVKALLGDEDFARTMRRYIDAVPSRHFSVRYYGGRVAEFVAHDRDADAAQVLGDLARWEWTLAEVFDAPDDVAAPVDVLSRVPPDKWASVSFTFRASLRRGATHSNAVQWWRSVQGECGAPDAYRAAARAEWVLWRRGIKTMFRSVEPIEALGFDAAQGGATFGDLCELIAREVDETQAPLRAASMLRTWFADELLARIATA